MAALATFPPLPAASRGVDPLDADATGALARLASDAQTVERAIGNRFSGSAVVANFNRALASDAAIPGGAWADFYFALARFLNVASMIVVTPLAPDALAALQRLQTILADDFGATLLAAHERRRLTRRLRRLADATVAARS
jgi:hypothetical protein